MKETDRVSGAAYATEAEALLSQVRGGARIPYAAGGMSLAGMDCQGLCEYLLIRCGVPRKECNLSGSNAHWRACVWRGTPEKCAARFGRVPAGAWVFIVNEEDGGAPAKYRGDGFGDASHMGIYVGKGVALHASASRGCVAESRFEEKTIPNGGWNRVGLPGWVDFGLDVENGAAGEDGEKTMAARQATVISLDGNPVKLRPTPSKDKPYLAKVPVGTEVDVMQDAQGWAQVRLPNGKVGYMMSQFLQRKASTALIDGHAMEERIAALEKRVEALERMCCQ